MPESTSCCADDAHTLWVAFYFCMSLLCSVCCVCSPLSSLGVRCVVSRTTYDIKARSYPYYVVSFRKLYHIWMDSLTVRTDDGDNDNDEVEKWTNDFLTRNYTNEFPKYQKKKKLLLRCWCAEHEMCENKLNFQTLNNNTIQNGKKRLENNFFIFSSVKINKWILGGVANLFCLWIILHNNIFERFSRKKRNKQKSEILNGPTKRKKILNNFLFSFFSGELNKRWWENEKISTAVTNEKFSE